VAAWGKMTAKEAGGIVVRFGKFKGQSIEEIAISDEGLKYLDWIVGQDFCYPETKEAIQIYLGQPGVQKDLESLLDDE